MHSIIKKKIRSRYTCLEICMSESFLSGPNPRAISIYMREFYKLYAAISHSRKSKSTNLPTQYR